MSETSPIILDQGLVLPLPYYWVGLRAELAYGQTRRADKQSEQQLEPIRITLAFVRSPRRSEVTLQLHHGAIAELGILWGRIFL